MANKQQQLAVVEDPHAQAQISPVLLEESWLQQNDVHIQVINVVGTVDLQTPIELKTVALHARNAEYNPKRFSAGMLAFHENSKAETNPRFISLCHHSYHATA